MKIRPHTGRATAATIALILAFVPRAALGNGAFPSASQLLTEPGEPDHLVLRTTFGVLTTRDRGENWSWLCEAGMHYKDLEPPMALLEGGTILLAVPEGISRSDPTGCDFELVAGIDGLVVDLTRVAEEPQTVIAVSTFGTTAQLWQSADAGASFIALGPPIEQLIVASVDAAPSDPDVVYVSGLEGTAGVLLRSRDRGASFERFPVPGTGTAHIPYIAAVAPDDRDTVYVRLSGTRSELEVTRDGGESFALPLPTIAPLTGFALSPDGRTVLASNGFDGTYRASTESLEFEKVACGGPSCMSFGPAGLFGCGDDMVDGFIVGRSDDLGATFERVVNLSCVAGPLDCSTETSVGSVCPDAWPEIQKQLKATTCVPRDVEPYTGCFAGQAGEGPSAGAAGGSSGAESAGTGGMPGSGGLPATGGRAGGATSGGGGCDCRVPRAPDERNGLPAALGLALVTLWRRRARVVALAGLTACSEPPAPPPSACVANLVTECSPLYDPPLYSTLFEKILHPTCAQGMGTCHTSDGAMGGLVLEDADDAYARLLGEHDGRARVKPGDPRCSPLVERLEAQSSNERMPPGPTPLTAAERCTVVRWIADGAAR